MAIKLTKSEIAQLTTLMDNFDAAKSALADVLGGIRDEWQNEWDERSERWQESDAGSDAQDRIDAIEQLMDDIEQIDANLDIDKLS